MTESWEEITVPKPRNPDLPTLGRGARPKGKLDHDSKKMPLPNGTDLRTGAHARCVDHVRVDGLDRKVCILRGDDPEAVIADALDLAGVE